jgi:hypothetical protein
MTDLINNTQSNIQNNTSHQIKRQTAIRIWLSNLNNGSFVKGSTNNEQFIPSYVDCNNKKVSRVNIIATVIETFKSDDGNYYSYTLDDSTATIRLKAFNEDVKNLINIERGNVVSVIGRVREYQDELYISPEIVKTLESFNQELIRKAELLKSIGKPEKLKEQSNVQLIQVNKEETAKQDSSHKKSNENMRQEVVNMLNDHVDSGLEVIQISQKIGENEKETEKIIKELMLEGEIYENKPGCYKAI